MKPALTIGFALLTLAGCGKSVPVDLTSAAARDVTFEPGARFAIIHASTGAGFSRRLAQETVNALHNRARRAEHIPLADQQPLLTSADSNATMHDVAALVRRAFARAGYKQSGRDPQIAISIEFTHGPFEYRAPRPAATEHRHRHSTVLETTYAHGVLLHVYDAQRREQPIWVGYAISINDVPDFDRVGPALVEVLTKTYPNATTPVRRVVSLR